MPSSPPKLPKLRPGELHLRLLNLTDLHMDIRGYDYFNESETPRGGLARAAGLIEALRAQAPNTLLFDNGDMLQGNPMGDYAAHMLRRDGHFPHPMIAALNRLGLDAATLGNHEFNFGLTVLRRAIAQAAFPVVVANAVATRGATPAEDTPFLPPYVLLSREFTDAEGESHRLKIGVLGLLPPQIVNWDRKHLASALDTRDIVDTARHYLPEMHAAGADLTIVLCHSGLEEAADTKGLENAALPVAALQDADIVIAGHSHLVFPSTDFADLPGSDLARGLIHGTPVTMAGFGGSHVGRIDIVLAPRDHGGWRVRESQAAAEEVSTDPAPSNALGAAILKATDDAHNGTRRHMRHPVGRTDIALDSYFAMIAPSASVRLVATAQAWSMAAALKGTDHTGLPILSAAAPFKMGGRGGPDHFTDVPKGEVALRHVADLYGYPNLVHALEVSGAALRDWLEFSAGIFAQVLPGREDQKLIDPEFPAYHFDTITGVTYEIDLTRPARFTRGGQIAHNGSCRIRALTYAGRPVTDDMRFVVATNDYRTSRSGQYPGADDGEIVFEAREDHREMLSRYFAATEPGRRLADPPWSFHPVPGASVLFETGRRVLDDPDRLRALSVEPLGVSDTGFLTCRSFLA